MRRFGGLIGSAALLLASGCYHFTGGGLPSNIRTVALSTFDNQTASPDLPKELYDQFHRELRRRLGLRDAPTDRADALVHGVIQSYDADVPVGFSADPNQTLTARRRLQITIEIEIVDQSNGHVLYANKGLREEADYDERAEPQGRTQAITKIVQKVIEDVQSNW
ncbi:MAG TPA: LPS assembly lipoprotein LptE [Gemmatimonadaceae bacterium]|nr:LPS assembly lipoprotein LptE [Gemmatimonadaceae bacterium]